MTEESISERIARIKARMADKRPDDLDRAIKPDLSTWGTVKNHFRKWAAGYITAGVIGGGLLGIFAYDAATKYQDIPVRNGLISTIHKTEIAGNKEKRAADRADRRTEIKFFEGGGTENKVGTKLAETHREIRGDLETFTMYDTQNMRIATSAQKPERFQAGMRLGGSTNYKETKIDIVLPSKSKAPQSYRVYHIDPERGFQTNDIDVVQFPVDRELKKYEPGMEVEEVGVDGNSAKSIRVMINRLEEKRSLLGWLWGKNYRDGTLLQSFLATQKNESFAGEFFDTIKTLDSVESVKASRREELVKKMLKIEGDMDKITTYSTFEDGFFKILPQGSTVYFGENPGRLTRYMNWLGFGRADHNRLRINNHWDLFPGNYPGLNQVTFGRGKNANYLFDKYNNGGYTLEDKFGQIAQIDIQDFFFHRGQSVVYHYYLDLNGDGEIDKEKEEIGSVLCTPTHDEKAEIGKLAKGILPENDLTITTNYYFMAPDSDIAKGWDYFKKCAYIESIMSDQLNRGTGQHSLLGFINDQRSDIMLFREPSVQNMSRALTTESTLVAEYDIIRILNASGRPYAQSLAKLYGIDQEEEFAGKFSVSPLIQERIQLGAWPWLLGLAGMGVGGYYGIRHLKRRRALAKEQRMEKYKINGKNGQS
jgi:hypothetical protein